VSLHGLALWFYQRIIARDIGRSPPPGKVGLIIADSDLVERDARLKLQHFVMWCLDLGVEYVSVYVSVLDHRTFDAFITRMVEDLKDFLARIPAKCTISTPSGDEVLGPAGGKRGGSLPRVLVSVGLGGKQEVLEALRSLMADVEAGRVQPEEIGEHDIAARLKFKSEPDLIIRTGEVRLSDFLLWQAVYSEFHFSDVNWNRFRKVDLLRAVRDYQARKRRFGK